MFAVPAFGQVQRDVAVAVPGGAGGDVDQVAADGGAAGLGVGEAGQGAGGAQQVVRDSGAGQPGGVGGEEPDGRCASGPSVTSAKTCSTIGVVAVLSLGLDQLERGVGEDGVVAPGGEQLVLAGGGLRVQVADPADDQPRGDGLAFLRGERGVLGLGDLGVGDPGSQLVVPDRARVTDGRSRRRRGWRRWRRGDLGSIGTVTENRAPARRTAPMTAAV